MKNQSERLLAVPRPGCFKPGCLQFLRGSALLRSFAPSEPEFLTFLRRKSPSSGFDKRVLSKRVVLADVPRNENRNEGTFGMFPRNENQNEGTFAVPPGTKTGTRARSPKLPFYETALLSPSDKQLTKFMTETPFANPIRRRSDDVQRADHPRYRL